MENDILGGSGKSAADFTEAMENTPLHWRAI